MSAVCCKDEEFDKSKTTASTSNNTQEENEPIQKVKTNDERNPLSK